MRRMIIATMIAPMAMPFGVIAFGGLVQLLTQSPDNARFRDSGLVAIYGALIAYPLTCGVLPVFVWLRNRRYLLLWHFTLAGLLVAIVPFVLFQLYCLATWLAKAAVSPNHKRELMSEALYGAIPDSSGLYYASCGMAGGISIALAFWVLLGSQRNKLHRPARHGGGA